MSRFLKIMAVLCLLLSATAIPSAPSFAQPLAPADVDANSAVDAVNDLARRMKDAAADVASHRFAPAYYAEPCEPTKADGERSLAPYRAQRRAFMAEISALKARIIQIEGFSSGAVVLANKGWKVHDQNRFRALDQAYRAFDGAIAAKEAELDRMPVQPCRKTQPQPPRDPDGPLTGGEEAQFGDLPLATPTFDDPVTLPTPPKFCTFAERKAWMDSVYWPTIKRAEANAVKAIDAFGKAEQRLREVRANDRADSPRIALAEQAVRFWQAEKNRRMAEHQRLLAIDVPNPVDCSPPSTTDGTATTTPNPPATTTPAADAPAAPPPPLPPGVNRPQFERAEVPTLPKRFCSEKQKQDFLVDVYHPAADAASKNAVKASTYRARLSQLIQEAAERGDQAAVAALRAEYDAFKPIAEEAEALAQRMYRMRAEILAIPVVDCTRPERPKTSPPPVEGPSLEEMVVEGTRIQPGADGGPSPTTPKPPTTSPKPPAGTPKPPSDSSDLSEIIVEGERIRGDESRDPTPPTATAPRTPPPNLSRPQFERVREVTVPAKFCSAQERNDFLNNVYNPAAAAALANARAAQEHQAKLNALFTEHMKANSEHWGAVRAERDAYEAVAREATAEAEALRQLYAKIMAVPVVPCPEAGDEADPVDDAPAGQTGQAVPRVEEALPGFRRFELPAIPDKFCTEQEAQAALETVKRLIAEIEAERERMELAIGAALTDSPERRRSISAQERAQKTPEEIRNEEEEGLIAAGRRWGGKDLDPGRAAAYGRAQVALGIPGIQTMQEYDQQLASLEVERNTLEATIRAGQYEPCPKKPCPPKKGRDPIAVGPNSKVGSGAQLRSKLGGMATGAVLGALGVGGGGGSEPRLWTCKIKDSEYTVFNDPVTGVSLRVGAKRAKGGKVVIFSEIAKSPDKGTFQTAFLERPSTGETLAPSDIGPCDLWGEWKLTVSWTKTTYVNGQVVDRQSGGWSEGGFFKIPGVLSPTEAPDGFWKQMGFSSAQMGAREMGMIFDVPPGGGPLTFVIHVTRPKADPVTTVPFVLTMTEGPGGFVFTKAEDPPCPPETASAGALWAEGLWDPTSSAPPPPPVSTTSDDDDDEDPGDSDDRPSGPTPEEAYAIQRAETGAQEMVAAWRASDAELLTQIRNQKDCDPTIRDRLLAGFRERERMLEEGGGDIFNVAIRRAFELDGPRMKALKDLLGENACPATTLVTAPPPPLALASEAPLPPPQPALPPPPPPQALPPWYVDHLPMVQAASSGNLESMRELIDEADKKPCPDGYKTVLDRIRWSRDEFRRMVPRGRGADSMRDVIDETLKRLDQMEDEVLKKMAASRCPPSGSVFKTDGPDPTPAPYTPPPGGSTGPRLPFTPPPERPISEPAKVDRFVSEARTADSGLAKALEEAARACPADPARSWTALRNRARAVLVARLMFLSSMRPIGPGTEHMTDAVGREFNRTMLLLQEVNALQPPPCPGQAPDQQPTEEETESILDDIEEKLVIG